MIFKQLNNLKKKPTEVIDNTYTKNLIIGNDIFSLATYHMLSKFSEITPSDITPHEEILIIGNKKIEMSDLLLRGPSLLRGTDNINIYNHLYNTENLNKKKRDPLFFKEQKFRSFSGRSRSQTIFSGEEYFINPSITYEIDKLFPFINDENFIKFFNDNLIECIPSKINKTNNNRWKITCSDGTNITCDNLFIGTGPNYFISLCKEDFFSPNFIELCNKSKGRPALYIKFTFEQNISELNETLFLPLSYTHDHGHFIGEFKNSTEQSSPQIEFLNFLDLDKTSEDDITKSIKAFKRNLEKIFPDFKKSLSSEFITVNEESFITTPNDIAFKNHFTNNEQLNLYFIGFNAPLINCSDLSLDVDTNNITHLMRGLLSLKQLEAT